jgi:hypothetical protein
LKSEPKLEKQFIVLLRQALKAGALYSGFSDNNGSG